MPLTQNPHYEEIADDHIGSDFSNNSARPSASHFADNNFQARIDHSQSNSQNSEDYLLPQPSISQVYNNLSSAKQTSQINAYRTM